ncbi:ABC transporter permease subunit [bacterium]|nr:ABC transporter permease subunit [bacterium]
MTATNLTADLRSSLRTKNDSKRRRFYHDLLHHRSGMIGLSILAVVVFMAVFAPLVAPFDPIRASVPDRLQPPGLRFIMGTDELGRDVFSRVVFGARISLTVGLVSVSIAVTAGTVLGLISGYYKGTVDMLLQRLVDMMMALPRILLAMAIVFALGVGLTQVMIAVGISSIPSYVRVVRASVLSAREQTYVEAARVVGRTDVGILFRHILPNVAAPILILVTLGIAGAILTAAGLSFLGLGAQPPTPEWGAVISAGRNTLRSAWWISTFPGIAITVVVIAINMLGDALRDILDPRLQRR